MTAPALVTRVLPTAARLKNGHRTLIAFASDPDVPMYEIGIKPPGWSGGEKIKTTTQHNDELHTFAARTLKEMTDGSITVAYAAEASGLIGAMVNVEGGVTILYPTLATLSFYGYLMDWDPGEMVEGEMPQATCGFVCTNTDPITGAEEGPVFAEPPAGLPMLPSMEQLEAMSDEERETLFEERRLIARSLIMRTPERIRKGREQKERKQRELMHALRGGASLDRLRTYGLDKPAPAVDPELESAPG